MSNELISNEECEDRIASKTAPKVTEEQIDARIASVHYVRLGETVTICNIQLDNGYSVRGESACVSPENYDRAIGERIAYDNAYGKLWPLFGFLLAEGMASRKDMLVVEVARVCHEVNRAYCAAIGDDSQPEWRDAPGWQRNSAVEGVHFHLENPDAPASASHDSWMRQKIEDGWVYGETKDPEAKTHPCMVPFEDLPREQKVKDHLFKAVVHACSGYIQR